jgi:hypothetical protein
LRELSTGMECQLEGISVHYTVYGDGRPINTLVGEWLDRVEEHMAFQGQPHLEENAGG